jgi:hypothetical protein
VPSASSLLQQFRCSPQGLAMQYGSVRAVLVNETEASGNDGTSITVSADISRHVKEPQGLSRQRPFYTPDNNVADHRLLIPLLRAQMLGPLTQQSTSSIYRLIDRYLHCSFVIYHSNVCLVKTFGSETVFRNPRICTRGNGGRR